MLRKRSSTGLYPRTIVVNGDGFIMVSQRQNEGAQNAPTAIHIYVRLAHANRFPTRKAHECTVDCVGVPAVYSHSSCCHRRQKGAHNVKVANSLWSSTFSDTSIILNRNVSSISMVNRKCTLRLYIYLTPFVSWNLRLRFYWNLYVTIFWILEIFTAVIFFTEIVINCRYYHVTY